VILRRHNYSRLQVLQMEAGGAISLEVMRRPHRGDLAPALSGTTVSAEYDGYGLHVMVKKARDRQIEYLKAQQEVLEDESGDEFSSNSHGGKT
jgi:hypothetical protein